MSSVSEVGSHRISVFTKKGAFDRCYGRKGLRPGEFTEPRGLAFAKGWLLVADSRRVSVLSPVLREDADAIVKQVIDFPVVGQLWGICAVTDADNRTRAFVTDTHAGKAKVHVLDVVGAAHDDGLSASDAAAQRAALRKAAEEEKLREWQEARAKSQGKA